MNFPNSEPNFHDINESFEGLSVNSPYHYEQVEYFESQHLADPSEYYDQSASQPDSGSNSSPLSPLWDNSDSIVTELGPDQVRWFYKAHSDKKWLEFSGYDSLRVEFAYRQIVQDYFSEARTCQHHVSYDSSRDCCQQAASHSEEQKSSDHRAIVVRGGMYEVDLYTYKCTSIYWPGEECIITRGTWFYDGSWLPFEAQHSDHLESIHLHLFYGHKMSDFKIDNTGKTVLHTEYFPEFHVDWTSTGEIYLYSEATPSKLVRSVTQKLGFQKSTGWKLYRGYKVLATQSDRPADITHLVFVIHGIGQKMDTGRIIRNTSSLRDCITWIKNKYFPTSEHRAEFFPVEWRSSLKLDGDIVEAITPQKLLTLRNMLNSSAMDIMYYTSPLYGEEVQKGLCEELNRLYSMFSERNPYFISNGGKVSVVAHSLGCVIVYDIVTGWVPGNRSEASKNFKLVQSKLNFQIDSLFCLGSPLSVFLALRCKEPTFDDIVPASLCRRLFNIFHPSDPVAYRLEPLLLKEFAKISPLQILAYNNTSKIPYSEMPLELIVPEGTVKRDLESETPESASGTPNKGERGWNLWNLMRSQWKPQDDPSSQQPTPNFGIPYRLDYVLRDTHLPSSYLAALTSHTAYWNHYDVAFFILTQIFPELNATSSSASSEASSKSTL